MKRFIPIKKVATGAAAAAAQTHVRLEQAGFMRMMSIGEPRLSQLVDSFRKLGYEVEIVPYTDEDDAGESGTDRGPAAGDEAGRAATIYVRKRTPQTPDGD